MDTNFVVATIVAILLGFAAVVAAYYLVGYLRAIKDNAQLSIMIGWITVKIRELEQELGDMPGPRKKELALIFSQKIATQLRLSFSQEQLSSIIEACVYGLKEAAKMTPGEADDKFVDAATKGL